MENPTIGKYKSVQQTKFLISKKQKITKNVKIQKHDDKQAD